LFGEPVPQPPSRAPGISPWLFVVATALNTMVASFLAVIITLGVVTQEQTNGQQREAVLPSAYARPMAGVRNETTALNTAVQPIDLRPIDGLRLIGVDAAGGIALCQNRQRRCLRSQ